MNCNEKEMKAKLYNNRAIAHFKLGKMMRALICIFLSSARAFSSFSEKGDNFEYMSKNKKIIRKNIYALSWPLKHTKSNSQVFP